MNFKCKNCQKIQFFNWSWWLGNWDLCLFSSSWFVWDVTMDLYRLKGSRPIKMRASENGKIYLCPLSYGNHLYFQTIFIMCSCRFHTNETKHYLAHVSAAFRVFVERWKRRVMLADWQWREGESSSLKTIKQCIFKIRKLENRCLFSSVRMHVSHDLTKPTKWVCAQRRLRSAWASAQSDQSLRCALNG